jgi:hypothetical protein
VLKYAGRKVGFGIVDEVTNDFGLKWETWKNIINLGNSDWTIIFLFSFLASFPRHDRGASKRSDLDPVAGVKDLIDIRQMSDELCIG